MLRREELGPLRSDRQLVEEEDEPFSTIFISPCQIKVSNDPFQSNETAPDEDVLPCNRTAYECPKDNIMGNTASEPINYEVNFDYEVHYVAGTSLERSLEELEDLTLQHLAVLADLFDCEGRRASAVGRNGGSRKLQSILEDQYRDALVGISSEPVDVVDPNHSECTVPVEGLSGNTQCTPIKGSLSFKVDPNSTNEPVEEEIRGSILSIVREAMLSDTYLIENVEKVSYIGTREAEQPGGIAAGYRDTLEANGGGAALSTMGIAFIAVGGILSLTLFALFAARRRRQNDMEGFIVHDATVEAQNARELKEADNVAAADWTGEEYVADTLANNGDADSVEGADIPGSMANSDALALQPDPYGDIKTGDLETEDDATLSGEHVVDDASLGYSSDNQSYITDITDGDAGSAAYAGSDGSSSDDGSGLV